MEATKAKLFASKYIETGGNATKAVQALGRKHKSRAVAGQTGYRMLKNVDVQKYLAKIAGNAVQRVESLADKAKSEHVKLLANQDILDRAGFSPKKESEGNKTLIINITGETAARYGLLGGSEKK